MAAETNDIDALVEAHEEGTVERRSPLDTLWSPVSRYTTPSDFHRLMAVGVRFRIAGGSS